MHGNLGVFASLAISLATPSFSLAQGTVFQLGEGSQFISADGEVQNLMGVFAWEQDVVEPDYVRYNVTALRFQTAQYRFELHPDFNGFRGAELRSQGILFLMEYVQLYDVSANPIHSDLVLYGPNDPMHLPPFAVQFPHLTLSTWEGGEILGSLTLNLVNVPEPKISWLLLLGMGSIGGVNLLKRFRA